MIKEIKADLIADLEAKARDTKSYSISRPEGGSGCIEYLSDRWTTTDTRC